MNFPMGQEWQLELYLRDLPHHVFARQPRRLFGDVRDTAARDRAVEGFYQQYRQGDHEFPRRMPRARLPGADAHELPHPPRSLLAAIRGLGGGIDRFQRTRRVLRLMADAIHRLWEQNDQEPPHLAGLATPVRLERAAAARLDRRDRPRQTYTASLELIEVVSNVEITQGGKSRSRISRYRCGGYGFSGHVLRRTESGLG